MLGVAAGRIGAIKSLEHLSSVVTHVGGHVLPGFVSIASVQDVFDEDGMCTDPGTEKRVRGLAKNVMDYLHQFICPPISMEAVVRG
jgi:NAD(P)H-dependent FMN reductase